MERSSGILLHISSLPEKYGIGTLGKQARKFADFLVDAGQKYWQILPLGHTSYGDSPYQCFSAFAGNPYFIDLDTLIKDGLLTQKEVDGENWGRDAKKVDYAALYFARYKLLRRACKRDTNFTEISEFKRKNAAWLDDYSMFMALKSLHGMKGFTEWENKAAANYDTAELNRLKPELQDDIDFYSYSQYLFFKQLDAFLAYLKKIGLKLIGDIPIYVAMDSADVWAHREIFQMDELTPTHIAGVPPDYFCEDGQLWGNPLYNWDYLKKTGYKWWIDRLAASIEIFDVVRIDHFRGFESYWSVPFGEKTAKNGTWEKGPGIEFIERMNSWFDNPAIIAEDLGFLTPEVRHLLKTSGYPGMKVLQFAFDTREPSDYRPHTYPKKCAAYIGTHDNTTLAGWLKEAKPADVEFAREYLGLNKAEGFVRGFIRGVMSSVAELAVVQMQDYLELGADARMNRPATLGGNWQWRMTANQPSAALVKRIFEISKLYDR